MPVQSDDELAKKIVETQKQQELEARAREIKAEQDERLEAAKQKIRERREAAKAEAKAEAETYTVQAGDTLGKIAQKVYNDAGRWKEIFEANKETIKNPDLIQVGQQLKIP
ncbi:MAG: LysM peptidoglycan-binding domain-containing protein [Anaerolineae bacterium]|jgi:nucleoid-associated protein YgaU